jgi:RNA polymerase sigma-70 factor (ECF subfamily)
MESPAGAVELPRPVPGRVPPRSSSADARLRAIVGAHFDFLWRSLRRLGVPSTDVDDCAQQVFLVAARKLDEIVPDAERAFLFGTAMRVASDARRSRTRRREVHEDDAAEAFDPAPDPEQIADRRRARAVLDEVLDALPMDLRAPFVLFELEELPTAEIAVLLDLPAGTVASRLRRAREEFQRIVERRKARDEFRGGKR